MLQRLATKEAVEALVLALSSGSAQVRKAAARNLSRVTRRHRAIAVDVRRIEAAIQAELGRARLALGALRRLDLPVLVPGQRPRTSADLLALALLEERDQRVLRALLLLEVLLPHVRMDVVGENLRGESAAARGNAIEVLEHALPDPWKHLVLTALDEARRRGDLVPADARPVQELVAALAAGESGAWVAACAVHWAHERHKVDLRVLAPALRTAIRSNAAPLREAAARALFGTLPREEARAVLAGLITGGRAAQGAEGDGMITTVEKVLFLKSVDLFRALPGEELAQIAEIAEEQPFAAGEQVFAEGEPGDALYLVLEGAVKVHQSQRQLAHLGVRDVFGEMAIVDSEPRSASVTAVQDAVLLKIARDDFRDILLERPEIGMGIIKVLSRRLRDASRR